MLPVLPSISDAQTLMRRGKLRPIDLVEHCLGRIHQFEDQIHAWVMVDEEGARQEAHRLGKMLDDGQEPVGPLHGIPIGIKDIIDVAGWPTLCGSKLREGHVAEKDAAVVDKLRKAGAIILGKTVTTEWASFDPPPTRNPWNLNHTPGGSSSGSAAAVALEMCMAALGTQTGGSIIRPASYCGIVGLKPDFHYASMAGIYPFSKSLDHVGPMARTVEDVRVVYDSLDQHPFKVPLNVASRNLWLLDGAFLRQSDATTRRNLESVRERLSQHFAIDSIPVPEYFQDVHSLHRCIMSVDAADIHRETYEQNPANYSVRIRGLIEEGRNTTAHVYARALRRQKELQARFSNTWSELGGGWGIFMMASTATAAPGLETTGDPVFNSPWSFLRAPAVTIPIGTTPEGLPLGLQFVTSWLKLFPAFFDVVQECESIIGFNSRPPLLCNG